MKRVIVFGASLFASAALLAPAMALAYSAVWVGSTTTPIAVDDASQARGYFGELAGSPETFAISASEPVRLYVTVLQPQIAGAKQDLSVAVLDPKNPDIPLGVILGPAASWTPATYEGQAYTKGPEYRATLPAGNYEIRLWSTANDAPYVVVIGETDQNFFARMKSALSALPQIDRIFFGRTPAYAIFAPILLGPLVVALLIIAAAIWALAVWRFRD